MSNSGLQDSQKRDGRRETGHLKLMKRLCSALDAPSSRHSRLSVISTLTRDGMEGLAAAILARAALDWAYEPTDAKAYVERADREIALLQRTNPSVLTTLCEEYDGQPCFGSLRRELAAFWHGEEGRFLRDYFGLSWLDLDDIVP